jgi:hypothetical protein
VQAFNACQLSAAAAFVGLRTDILALLARLKADAALLAQHEHPA